MQQITCMHINVRESVIFHLRIPIQPSEAIPHLHPQQPSDGRRDSASDQFHLYVEVRKTSLPSAAWITLTSSPLNVLLASSSSAHSGDEGVVIPLRAELEPATFSSTLGGQILATDFLTEGLLRISSMLNGVRGLLEFAGGGSWSSGARLLSSPPECNTEPAFMSVLEVIAVPENRCFQKS